MTSTIYEDPESALSGYESMRTNGSRSVPPLPRRPKSVNVYRGARRVRVVSRRRYGYNAYPVFTLVCLAILVAMGAYLIIAIENLKYLKFAHTTAPECKMTENAEERLSQMSTAVNTMMNSLTYTLPTVLNTQKATLLARMNHLVTEIKEVARLNNVDLNVRMGTNKTVALKTGNHGHTIHPRALTTLAPYTTKRIETFTLVPKTPKKYPGFYPMVKVDDAASLENRVIAVTKIFGDKGLDEESRYQTVWNLNPSN